MQKQLTVWTVFICEILLQYFRDVLSFEGFSKSVLIFYWAIIKKITD